jgi:sulfur-oxidizing protein SoxA
MRKLVFASATLAAILSAPATPQAGPADDLETYRTYYRNKFPGIPLEEFQNGVYAIDAASRESWEAIEEFPPYEPALDDGAQMWNTPFANGKTYKDCFPDGPAIAGKYPHWDKKSGMVVTLPLAINECRQANGEKPLEYKRGALATLLAYIAYQSRGQKTNVVIPKDDLRALKAYEAGKQFYFARRGQLNLACSNCHRQYPGFKLRTETLSPALGHTTGWPVYRSKWGELGTLHRRFAGCNKQVRAKPFPAQSEEYRNLEYFLTHMSNDIPLNGPSARK